MTSNIVIGIVAILVGAVFCLRGVVAMRIVITVWGAFVGFNLGAGLVSAIGDQGFLTSALGWVVGILLAVVFALLAYLYYAVAVLLAMASIGFALGTAVMAAVGVDWNWLVIVVGVVVGVLLAWAALAMNLPAILLVVLSALGGSTAIVGGLMLLSDTIRTSEFSDGDVTARVSHGWWWYLLYFVFVITGIIAQAKVIGRNSDLQQQW
ncbi:TMEM198/TM7SF3 family protein [Gordonia sp. PP30]|uniref:TMEM198/TM7SF3 family protein n=1 Tax=unclassified Gordonia (in: high G+C Gram-positive bacteria) TaxID=2657482 RepID=UPI001FFF12B9|nr:MULTISPECIES: TMEM198/TM7SF3 family protein [unclassified Gordonia (in: high G+C Gram-positive bacteria)]UQE74676.1 TMEM198/TM7SF3 family protein [Gordonia sp. PP30]